MRYQAGDRLLTLRDNPFSKAVAWWLNGRYSHCVPILSEEGLTLEARTPQIRFGRVSDYADATMLHLRPAVPFSEAQAKAWAAAGLALRGRGYDLKSLAGFLFGNGTHDPERPNCAELLLAMDHAAGLLTGRDPHLISPQSYAEFAAAGLFRVVE